MSKFLVNDFMFLNFCQNKIKLGFSHTTHKCIGASEAIVEYCKYFKLDSYFLVIFLFNSWQLQQLPVVSTVLASNFAFFFQIIYSRQRAKEYNLFVFFTAVLYQTQNLKKLSKWRLVSTNIFFIFSKLLVYFVKR